MAHPLDAEISRRIKSAARTYGRLKRVWGSELDLTHKLLFYNSFILPSLTYGCETWTLDTRQSSALSSFHNRCIRRLKGLPYDTRISDLHDAEPSTFTIAGYITQQRLRFLGHLARRESGFLPSLLLSAHHFVGSARCCRGVGASPSTYCNLAIETLRAVTLTVDVDADDTGVLTSVHVRLRDLISQYPGIWLVLATFRGWWRSVVVACARELLA